MTAGAVVIGRNEGMRLPACLASLRDLSPIVYVDSGSTDGSVAVARRAGAEVVELDPAQPFTAARARNEGLERLRMIAPDARFAQVLDGDTALRTGWMAAAMAEIESDPHIAVVCGRRRERAPGASIWNAMIDAEWDTPVGEARECGGDALLRLAAIAEVGGYDPGLIAGEEPEMCHRLRAEGWLIRRIDAEMTWHDADLTRFGQWWRRTVRAGHSYAALLRRHAGLRVKETRRALLWGLGLPALTFLAVLACGLWGILLLLAWPLQVIRLRGKGYPWREAFFLTLGKLPEAQGVLGEWLGRHFGHRVRIIEYK